MSPWLVFNVAMVSPFSGVVFICDSVMGLELLSGFWPVWLPVSEAVGVHPINRSGIRSDREKRAREPERERVARDGVDGTWEVSGSTDEGWADGAREVSGWADNSWLFMVRGLKEVNP